MEIITQNYEKILENVIINNFETIIRQKEKENKRENKVFNYIRILDTLDETICKIARESLETIINTLDRSYKNSAERLHRYHIKSNNKRTIMTIFGEITYNKTIYQHKHNYKTYCYIDDFLGLKKYDYFDPYIKAFVLEYAAKYPCTKVAQIINDMIGNRIKIKEPYQYITKQTIRNIILNEKLSKPELQVLETPEDLYIMADEKYVSTQNNDNNDAMIKEIVIFDGRETKNKRTTLKNKMSFASFRNAPLNECLDYMFYVYDMDKVKNIYVMGDGALWIKNLAHEFNYSVDTSVSFNLDKFHFKQAIHHIATNDTNIEYFLTDYVINNSKNNFIELCSILSNNYPERSNTINDKMNYILNNWKYIQNLYKNKLKCPMESQISHTLAELLSSRPKAYSLKTLDSLLNLRILFKNKYNIKLLFLNNINKKDVIVFNNEHLNISLSTSNDIYHFDSSLIPVYYTTYYNDSSINFVAKY